MSIELDAIALMIAILTCTWYLSGRLTNIEFHIKLLIKDYEYRHNIRTNSGDLRCGERID